MGLECPVCKSQNTWKQIKFLRGHWLGCYSCGWQAKREEFHRGGGTEGIRKDIVSRRIRGGQKSDLPENINNTGGRRLFYNSKSEKHFSYPPEEDLDLKKNSRSSKIGTPLPKPKKKPKLLLILFLIGLIFILSFIYNRADIGNKQDYSIAFDEITCCMGYNDLAKILGKGEAIIWEGDGMPTGFEFVHGDYKIITQGYLTNGVNAKLIQASLWKNSTKELIRSIGSCIPNQCNG